MSLGKKAFLASSGLPTIGGGHQDGAGKVPSLQVPLDDEAPHRMPDDHRGCVERIHDGGQVFDVVVDPGGPQRTGLFALPVPAQ